TTWRTTSTTTSTSSRTTSTTTMTPEPGARATTGHGMTVRARILVLVLVLTGLTLVVAGGTAYALQRARVDDTIDASLQRTAQEFSTYAADSVDPATGQPYTDPRSLIYAGMLREVPAANEGMIGFVD